MNPVSITRQARNLLLALVVGPLLTACVGFYAIPERAPSVTPAEQQAYLETQIDYVLDTLQNASKPGVSVIVRKDGVIVYNRSKGLADINLGTPITADTAFNIASIAKPITAIAVMQLVERNILSLDDSVLKWLPELPSTWNAITIHHLLSHTSGIPDYLHKVSAESLDGLNNQKLLQRFAANDTLLFASGTNARYSNSNYVLLAEIISRAAAMPYAQYLQENVFDPLEMRSTFVYGNAAPAGTSVALNYGRDAKVFGITLATVGPVGIFSSAADLNVLLNGLVGGKLVSMETLRLMTSPQSGRKVVDESDDFYGYGWFVPQQQLEPRVFWHSGSMDGFRSVLKVDASKGVEFVMLCNGGEATDNRMQNITYVVNQAYKSGTD